MNPHPISKMKLEKITLRQLAFNYKTYMIHVYYTIYLVLLTNTKCQARVQSPKSKDQKDFG